MPSMFDEIYAKNLWGIGSGGGADPTNLGPYLIYLQKFLSDNNIKTIIDVGCGDWQHMSKIDLTNINYIGVDCVSSVINNNLAKYTKDNIKFILGNFVDMDLPSADLLICKDVFQHLPNNIILQFLPQLAKFKHCLIINDTGGNNRLITGVDKNYAGLDCQAPPFNLVGNIVLEMNVCCVTKRVLYLKNETTIKISD